MSNVNSVNRCHKAYVISQLSVNGTFLYTLSHGFMGQKAVKSDATQESDRMLAKLVVHNPGH